MVGQEIAREVILPWPLLFASSSANFARWVDTRSSPGRPGGARRGRQRADATAFLHELPVSPWWQNRAPEGGSFTAEKNPMLERL